MSSDPASDFYLRRGDAPLIVSMPHVGIRLPAEIERGMLPVAAARDDTDWHLRRLYDFPEMEGVTILAAEYSRYLIDLNRPPEDSNLYPGQDTTGLCPVDTFAKAPLYPAGAVPDATQVAARREAYWRPYHVALAHEIERLSAMHGRIVLWDAHSIAAHVPRFFSGRLPDLNLGTADGRSCAPALQALLSAQLDQIVQRGVASAVVNGRFKGGYITRHYGQPGNHVHAVQMEMAQCTYMDEQLPYTYRPERAARMQEVLAGLLHTCRNWAGEAA